MRDYGELLKTAYVLETFKTKEGGSHTEEDIRACYENNVSKEPKHKQLFENRYKPVLSKKKENPVELLIDDMRQVREWCVEDAKFAHRGWYGTDEGFEEPPPHVPRMKNGGKASVYFAGEWGVGARIANVRLAASGRSCQTDIDKWKTTAHQRKELGQAMGYKEHVEWWEFPTYVKEQSGNPKATSSNSFEADVKAIWWCRREYVGDKHKACRESNLPFQPPEPFRKGGPGVSQLPIFSRLQRLGRDYEMLTDHQKKRVALALGGDEKFPWWPEK